MEVIFLLGQAENVDAVRAIVGRYSSPEQVESRLGRDAPMVGFPAGRAAGAHAAAVRGFAAQSLAALPDAELPLLGALRAVSIERRVRFSRSVAGFDGARLRRAGTDPGPHSGLGGAPVPRRRRPALVASRDRHGSANPLLRRSGLAALRGRALCASAPATRAFSTKRFRLWKVRCSKPAQQERMFIPAVSAQAAPLWEHCRRALDQAWQLGVA